MLFWAMLWTAIIVGAEIDIFVPSFPELQSSFSLDPFHVELVLTLNLISYGLASFWAGVWGDRYGHKRVVVGGLITFIVGSLMCWLGESFAILLIGRVVQGVGIAAPAVLCYAWLMDVYPSERHVSLIGLMNGMVTTAVSGAPILGSFITLYWGWRGNFAVLLVMGIVAWFLCSVCPNPSQKKRNSPKEEIFYSDIWSNTFVIYTMAINTAMGSLYYVFVGIASILYREGLGVSLQDFGWYQGAVCFTFAFFSLLCGTFVRWWGARNCMKGSLFCLFIFCVGLIGLVVGDVRSPMAITVFMCLYATGCAIPVTILYPLGINAIPEAKGKISAIQVASRLVFTAVGLQVAGYVYDGSFAKVGIVLLVILASVLFCFERLYRRHNLGKILAVS